MDDRLTPRQRIALALLWLALLAVAGWAIGQRLQVTGDLRKFMPRQVGSRLVAWLQAVATADGTCLQASGTRGETWATR
jgi:predicted exporter